MLEAGLSSYSKKFVSLFLSVIILFGSITGYALSLSGKAKTALKVAIPTSVVAVVVPVALRVVAAWCLFPGIFSHHSNVNSMGTEHKYENRRFVNGREIKLNIQGLSFGGAGGSDYSGRICELENPESDELKGKCIIVYSGNCGNGSDGLGGIGWDLFYKMANKGAKIIIVDYRGFGDSKLSWPSVFRISEKTIYQDGEEIYNYLKDKQGFSPENIILYGYSLGGAVASHVLDYTSGKNEKVAGAIFVSSIDSFYDRANCLAGKFVASVGKFIMNSELDTMKNLSNTGSFYKDTPMLFLSGGEGDWLSLSYTKLDEKSKEHSIGQIFSYQNPDCGHCNLDSLLKHNDAEFSQFINAVSKDDGNGK